MKENNFFYISFVAVIILLFVFVTAQIPVAHQSAKNIPVAFVNEDNGEMGQTLIDTIQEQAKAMDTNGDPMIKWEILESEQAMNKAFDDKEIYGAIVIPNDYSEMSASLQTPEPASPELDAYISQGKNMMVANVVQQTFTGMVAQMNQMMSEQTLSLMEENDTPLSVEQARVFTAPIQLNTTLIHETGELGSVPMSLFQPLWIGSLIAAALLFMAGRNRIFNTAKEQFNFRMIQVLFATGLGLLAGFILPWFTTFMLGYEFESFFTVASFLSITSISFILLILATITWIGIGGMGIYVLLMFFGLPLIQLAPEMLPNFYHDWIHPWLPMRFMFDGLHEILFFNGSVWNNATAVLMWILVISAILQLSKVGKRKNSLEDNAKSA